MPEQDSPEPEKAKPAAARRRAPAPVEFDRSASLAYVPLPGRKKAAKRGDWTSAALIAAGALAAAAAYQHLTSAPPPAAAEASESGSADLPKINATVVDHYNPFVRASRRPDLASDKVQFINGVYSVVPPDTKH